MNPFDLTYFGYGAGIILIGFLVGFVIGAILNVINKVGLMSIVFVLLLFAPSVSNAADPVLYGCYASQGFHYYDGAGFVQLYPVCPDKFVVVGQDVYAHWSDYPDVYKYTKLWGSWGSITNGYPFIDFQTTGSIDFSNMYQILSLLIGSLTIVSFSGGVAVGRMV